jgi:hypothetical protein
LNDGSNRFKQQYFFPMPGCFKVVAGDFDGGGDLDILAISFLQTMLKKLKKVFCTLQTKEA